MPRLGGGNGTIAEYEIYLSNTTSDLIPATQGAAPSASPVASGTWTDPGEAQEEIFGSPQSARYLMLRSTREVNDKPWTSAAEIQLLKQPGPGSYFYPSGKVTAGACGGSKWSGNFLNWASMTAIDEFVYAMTGGNRTYDTADKVIIERARKTNNDDWYPWKNIGSAINGVAPNTVTPYSETELWIYNTSYGFNVAKTKDEAEAGSGSGYLDFFNVSVQVCDQAEGVEGNCTRYTDGADIWYKPEGLMQRNMERMRFGIMAYSNDNSKARDGGVLRAPMKFIGPHLPSGEDNPQKEYTEQGYYVYNPESYAHGNSGVLNYLNQFHKAGYKQYDPVSELFYECLNYFKDRGPTSTFYSGLTEVAEGRFSSLRNLGGPRPVLVSDELRDRDQ